MITRPIDMGKFNDQNFLINLGIGLTAQMVKEATREAKNRYGILAYAISALKALLKTKTIQFQLTLDGREIEAQGLACMIANGGGTGILGLNFSQSIHLDDGILDVIILSEKDLTLLLAASTNALFREGKHIETAFKHWQARNVVVKTSPSQPVNIDGEMAGETPIKVGIWHHAVKVVVPQIETGNEF